jgi:hypothetical protein
VETRQEYARSLLPFTLNPPTLTWPNLSADPSRPLRLPSPLASCAELKEANPLLSTSSKSSSPASISRSTTPTPGNPNGGGGLHGKEDSGLGMDEKPVVKNGLLKISVNAAKGLSLPNGGQSSTLGRSCVTEERTGRRARREGEPYETWRERRDLCMMPVAFVAIASPRSHAHPRFDDPTLTPPLPFGVLSPTQSPYLLPSFLPSSPTRPLPPRSRPLSTKTQTNNERTGTRSRESNAGGSLMSSSSLTRTRSSSRLSEESGTDPSGDIPLLCTSISSHFTSSCLCGRVQGRKSFRSERRGRDPRADKIIFRSRFALCSDVSRISDISVQTYLRSAPPSSDGDVGMGNTDIFLGGVKFVPEFVRACLGLSILV